MKKILKITILAVGLLCLIISCKKEKDDDHPIMGTWEWVRTIQQDPLDSLFYHESTPQKEGFAITTIFNPNRSWIEIIIDIETRSQVILHYDLYIIERKYHVESNSTTYDDVIRLIRGDNIAQVRYFRLFNNYLFFSYNWDRGFQMFKRENNPFE